MKKNKGMKIYKQRKRRKGSDSQILSILGTVAVVFGAGIFGYYVIAVPISQIAKSRSESQTVISDSAEADRDTKEESASAVTTYKKIFEDFEGDSSSANNSFGSAVTEAAVTVVSEVPAVTGEITAAPVTTAAVTAAAPAVTEASAPVASAVVKGGCCYLTVSDIISLDALTSKLDSVSGCTSVAVPLKTTGGYVNYDSEVSTARLSGAVSSYLTLQEIVSAVTEKGLTPVAELSTVADNIYPKTYKKSAYQFDDGYTGEWLDNKPESGGKPWTSPFSSETQEYLSSLVNEITAAGIKSVICTDNYFPPFREKDLGYIGEIVKSPDRYKGLTGLVNMLNSAAASNGGKAMLSVSASDVLNSSAEVFKPEEFGSMSAVVTINMNDFGNDSLNAVLTRLNGKMGSMKLIPCIVTEGRDDAFVKSSTDTFKSMGYDLYMIK
ncbi:MAG: hypothetical protein MJ095_08425 [Oscillospiraceae bacterium]|nr:hypothetical protein [Oscillospiraceae bacterium]